jgi:hypothetical protein
LNTDVTRKLDNGSPDLFIVHIRSLDTVAVEDLDATVKTIDEFMKKVRLSFYVNLLIFPQLTADFRRVYSDNVVVARMASEHKNMRVKRQVVEFGNLFYDVRSVDYGRNVVSYS